MCDPLSYEPALKSNDNLIKIMGGNRLTDGVTELIALKSEFCSYGQKAAKP